MRVAALALTGLTLLGGMAAVPAQPITVQTAQAVAVPAQQQQEQRAPARVITARNELERVDELAFFRPRRVRDWDGKNRTSGDRAHKRMKQRRSSGRN